MDIQIPARPPFSLASVMSSHGWIQLQPFRKMDEAAFAYTTQLASGRVVDLHIRESPEGVLVETGDLDPGQAQEVVGQVNWMLNLEGDFSDFYTLAETEPKLQQAVETASGRILRSPTLFEDTVKTILTTNTSWSGTKRMVSTLVELFGDPLLGDAVRQAFPTPERLAGSDTETLRRSAGLGYRAPYVLELARAVASGDLDLEALKTADLPSTELYKRLLSIKGIGGYAAANLMMLLGRTDFIPIDSWALKVVSREWHQGQSISPKEVEAAFEKWGTWKGMVYWFWEYTEGD